jgi:hypothetical protein
VVFRILDPGTAFCRLSAFSFDHSSLFQRAAVTAGFVNPTFSSATPQRQ